MNTIQPLSYIERAYFEIQTILVNDPTIRQLLYFDTPDALNKVAPSIANVEPYIHLSPISKYAIEQFNQNTFIAIDIPQIDFVDKGAGFNSLRAIVMICVFTKFDRGLLDNNRLRLLVLCDRITALLNGLKMSALGSVEVLEVTRLVINTDLTGMVVGVGLIDDQTVATI